MAPSSIITHLNDIELDSLSDPVAKWRQLLLLSSLRHSSPYDNMGYCLPSTAFLPSSFGTHDECCSAFSLTPLAHPLCFKGTSSDPVSACLSPLSFFPPSTTIPRRCIDSTSCSVEEEGTLCARIEDFEKVLRITVLESSTETRVVVWQGPRRRLWNDGMLRLYSSSFEPLSKCAVIVKISNVRPRFELLPLSLGYHAEEFYS